MPLQTGTWTFNLSGEVFRLQIMGVSPRGDVIANLGPAPAGVSVGPVVGVWDEDSQKITLPVPLLSPENPNIITGFQLFTGFLFTDTVNLTGVTGSVIFTLAGYAENFSAAEGLGAQATAKRSVYGWYAQIGVD